MQTRFSFLNFLFFIFSFTNVFSITEKEYTHEKSLIDSQGLPTSIVDGCVNVISGDFVDFETDLAIPSSEFFTISRSYTSSDYFMQSLCNGWSFNHGSFAEIDKANKYTGIQIRNSSSILNYDSKERNTPKNIDRVRIDKSQWKKGMTNCAGGLPSAKSNLNNDVCDLEFNDKKLTYRRANGDKYFYTGPDNKKLYLWGIDKANTLKYLYLYDKKFLLNSIVLRNKFNQPLCSLSINVEKSKTEIKTPSGKTVTWHFKSIKNAGNHCPFLCKVERDNGPDISYEHERYLAPWGKHVVRLKEKNFPDNRFVKINYYDVGNNISSDKSISASIPGLNDFRYSRVIEIQKPLGPMGEPVTAFSFLYQGYANTDIKEKGFTEVFDALKRKRLYRYNKSRLEKIEYFQGDNQRYCPKLYRTEHILWAGAGTFYAEGHLIGSGLSDASGKLKYLNQYVYDNVGNITRATLYGNLSGSHFDNVIIGPNNIPIDLGCEAYSETFKYSIDGLNNLIEEDNGKRIYQYQYLPETTLCIRKLMIADNEIKSRAFYEYDHNAVLIKEICDDGVGYDRADQTRVTRKITKTIVPTWNYPNGLPLEVYTTAFDYANNQDIMLSKVHNIYEGDGLLVRKDIYDQTNTLAISQKFTYDKKGNLIKEEGPLGSFVEREFDGNGNIIKERGALDGYYKRNEYDFCNRLIKEEEFFDDNLSLAKSYHYDLAGQMISETDLFGNKINYTYDDLGRVIKQELPEIQDGNGGSFRPTSTYEYDVLDCVTKTVDPLGGETIASYTSRKAPYYKKYPDGTTETVVYHHNGAVKESIDRLGNKTVIESDYQERPLKVSLYNSKGELLKETSKTYSAFDVISETDELGIETTFDYDFAGRLACKRKLNFKECYEYDTLSRLYKTITYTSESDAVVSIKEYDLLNRVIEERVEDLYGNLNHRSTFLYDQANRKTHTITYGENGPEINETVYNKRGDIVEIIDPEGKVTRTDYEYGFRNALGQLVLKTTTVDPMGLKTIIEKDALGHDFIIEKVSPIGKLLHKSTFYYNGNGQRVKVIEENNLKKVVLEKEYDVSGNIIKVVEASNSEEAKVTRVEYNSLGQKSVVIKPSGITLNYNYDVLGRLERLHSSDQTIDYQYTYDVLGNLILVQDNKNQNQMIKSFDARNFLIEEKLGNDLEIKFDYDSLGQTKEVLLPDSTSISFDYKGSRLHAVKRESGNPYFYSCDAYDASSRLLKASLPGKAGHINQTFDVLGRITSIETKDWKEVIHEYDGSGNLVSRNIFENQEKFSDYFTYDDLYQLKSEKGAFEHNYTYDSFFNRLEKDGEKIEVNDLNQIVEKPNYKYGYDLDGHLISIKTDDFYKKFTYDALGRLTFYSDSSCQAEYAYDASNRRLEKKVTDLEGNILAQEKYLYWHDREIGSLDQNNEFISLRVLIPTSPSENRASVSIELFGKAYAPIHDHNGCISCLINIETGEVEKFSRYSAFGNHISKSSLKMPWGFASKRLDEETGFIFFGRRYYDPLDGRWITKDPLGDYDGPNLYAYVQNRPLVLIDHFGFMSEETAEEYAFWSMLKTGELSSMVKHTANHAGGMAKQAAGYAIEGLAHHTLFCADSPYLNGVFTARAKIENFGRRLQGNSDTSKSYGHSLKVIKIGDGPPGFAAIGITGILTDEKSVRDWGEQLFKDSKVATYMIFSETEGFAQDIFKANLMLCGIALPHAKKTAKEITKIYNEQTKANGGNPATLMISPHSRGAAQFMAGQHLIPSHVKEASHIRSFGALQPIPNTGIFGSVENYENKNDLIPNIGYPIWGWNIRTNTTPTGYSYGGLPSLMYDHFINSEGYRKKQQDACRKIFRN